MYRVKDQISVMIWDFFLRVVSFGFGDANDTMTEGGRLSADSSFGSKSGWTEERQWKRIIGQDLQ